jgi:hypothetical protein
MSQMIKKKDENHSNLTATIANPDATQAPVPPKAVMASPTLSWCNGPTFLHINTNK